MQIDVYCNLQEEDNVIHHFDSEKYFFLIYEQFKYNQLSQTTKTIKQPNIFTTINILPNQLSTIYKHT